MRITFNPKHANNDWYEELCALAAIGELSSSEFEELQHHLAECSDCRELYADFRRISADDLGLVAVLKGSECASDSEEASGAMDEHQLLSRLLDRARHERDAQLKLTSARAHPPGAAVRENRMWRWLRSPAPAYGALALMLAATAGTLGYRLGQLRENHSVEQLQAQLTSLKNQTETNVAAQKAAEQISAENRSARSALQKSLESAQAKQLELLARQRELQTELGEAEAVIGRLNQDLQTAQARSEQQSTLRQESQAKLQAALTDLNRLRQAQFEADRRTEEQQKIVADLNSRLQKAMQPAADGSKVGSFEGEARDLFGARDLHIVDVYDVDGNGKTRRAYGRVYYVEKKLLVFYAFDLQNKSYGRGPAAFQAWGYREPIVSKPENLGLFYIDDAAVNRWVLKVNNPRVLERIDAVFVTAEAPGGSSFPRGRRLLYASLSGPPNHP